MSTTSNKYNDGFEDYDELAWYWFTFHLIVASKMSGMDRQSKDAEWNRILRSLGVTTTRRKRVQEGVISGKTFPKI